MREWLLRWMTPDANGEGGSAAYNVHSLYLDGPDWSIYHETAAGAYSRYKLRTRCYDFFPNSPIFLEVKQRDGEAMSKSRAPVTKVQAQALLHGGVPLDLVPSRATENFRKEVDRRRAFPRVWVTYRRHAYVATEGRELVRITFDSRVRCGLPHADLSEPDHWMDLPASQGVEILELKYTLSYPAWVAEMVRRFHLIRKSMSKYRHSVELLMDRGLAGRAGRLTG
jgi:hypothetical protein